MRRNIVFSLGLAAFLFISGAFVTAQEVSESEVAASASESAAGASSDSADSICFTSSG